MSYISRHHGRLLETIPLPNEISESDSDIEKWRELFKIYNKQSDSRPIGMGCQSCYFKVAKYFIDKND